MEEVRALVGGQMMHGGGTNAELFEIGLGLEPHFVASDAGSVDPGPAFLGSGKPMTHKQGLKQSMEVMLKGCLTRRFLFSSAPPASAAPASSGILSRPCRRESDGEWVELPSSPDRFGTGQGISQV